MKLSPAQKAHIAQTDARAVIGQASAEGRARELGMDTDARLLRLSSRYMQHRAAGRTQAAAAVKRMAVRLKEARG